ncbi:MAG: ribosome-binding factor A [Crocinitomicaceae bacterium]
MGSIRQNKIESVIQIELSTFFQQHEADVCLGSMVTVTIARVTQDLSLARCYLSFF